jgi:hypothetical protein
LTYHDYLIQRGKDYKEKRQKQAEDKSNHTTDGCTFKPKTLPKKFNSTVKPSEIDKLNDAQSKWQELYMQATVKKGIDKKDRNLDDIEL